MGVFDTTGLPACAVTVPKALTRIGELQGGLALKPRLVRWNPRPLIKRKEEPAGPPEMLLTPQQRLDLAWELFQKPVRDYAAITALYNHRTDANHDHWNLLFGYIADDPKNPAYDAKTAHRLLIRAYKQGSVAAPYGIGLRWLHGDWGPVDIQRARAWFQRAFEAGHVCAGQNIVELDERDPRFASDPDYRAKVFQTLAEAAERGGPWPLLALARRLLTGDGFEKNTAKGLQLYESLVAQDASVSCKAAKPKAYAAVGLALRSFLGFDMREDISQSLALLAHVPTDHWEPDVQFGLTNLTDKLRHIITTDILPARTGGGARNSSAAAADHGYAADLVRALRTGERDSKDVVAAIDKKQIQATPALHNQLWAAWTLAAQEGWRDRQIFRNCWLAAQRQLLHVTEDQVRLSTDDMGPVYNKTEGRVSEYPLLGCFLDSSTVGRAFPCKQQRAWRKLQRVDALLDGTIALIEADYARGPIFLDWEDYIVALALVFGDPKGVVWPGLSLESIDLRTPERLRWTYEQKVWTPAWIGRTNLGRTYYATDYLLGAFAGSSHAFAQNLERHGAHPTNAARARALLHRLALAGGRVDGLWSRVMLQPKSINRDATPRNGARMSYAFRKVAMGVVGANCVTFPDGTEERSLNQNDNRYSAGRVANMLTDAYDEIADICPIFERLRQLNGLLYALAEFREKGFCPNADLSATIQRWKGHFESMPPLALNERLAI